MTVNRRASSLIETMLVLFLAAAVLASFGATLHTHLEIAATQRERADFDLRLVRLAEQFRESVRSALQATSEKASGPQGTRLVLEAPDGGSIVFEFRDRPARLTVTGTGPDALRDVILLPIGSRAWFALDRMANRQQVTMIVQCPRGRRGTGTLAVTRVVAFLGARARLANPKGQ